MIPTDLPNLTATENYDFATRGELPKPYALKSVDLVGVPYKEKTLFSQYSLGISSDLAIALALCTTGAFDFGRPINVLYPIGICGMCALLIVTFCTKEGNNMISSHILSEIALLAVILELSTGALLEEKPCRIGSKSSRHSVLPFPVHTGGRILERKFHVHASFPYGRLQDAFA